MKITKSLQKANSILQGLDLPLIKKTDAVDIKRIIFPYIAKNADEIANFIVSETKFYLQQFCYYINDYPNLNASSDIDNLHNYLIEQILIKRYRKKLLKYRDNDPKETARIQKLLNEAFSRMQKYESNLFVRRKDRGDVNTEKDVFDELSEKTSYSKDQDDITDAIKEWKKQKSNG